MWRFLILIICNIYLFSAELIMQKCNSFNDFYQLIKNYNIDKNIINNQVALELVEEINKYTKCNSLVDYYNRSDVYQLILDINNEIRLVIYKDFEKYNYRFYPINLYQKIDLKSIEFTDNKNEDFRKILNEKQASAFFDIAKNNLNIAAAKAGDKLKILFSCNDEPCSNYTVLASQLTINGKNTFLFYFKYKYYDEFGNNLKNYKFIIPIKYNRISSYFTPARFHPILKKVVAHLGVDLAAPKNTKIVASSSGVISFVGFKNGFGKTIKIKHNNGYETLYAHLNKYSNIKVGDVVIQGDLIGYVGSTGLATGPHLHFAVYYNKRAIDPLEIVKKTKKITSKQEIKEFYESIDYYYSIFNN